MTRRVLIVQADLQAARPLIDFFTERGDRIAQTADPSQACSLIRESRFDLVALDLHLPNDGDADILRHIRKYSPGSLILFTTTFPDPDGEVRAQAQGARFLLRQPFMRADIAGVVNALEHEKVTWASYALRGRPFHWRVPVRVKIALPFAILALLFALATAYVVTQVVVDSMEERSTNQLIESGKVTADWMAREENRILKTWRTLAFTQGIPEALAASDAERLRTLVLPQVVNAQEESVELLNTQGQSVLSLRHRLGGTVEDYVATRGDDAFTQWEFVRYVLANRVVDGRDKNAGVAHAPWGDYFYIAGPILNADGHLVGALLIGKSLPTLVRQIREATMAHITIYAPTGHAIASTLLLEQNTLPFAASQTVWTGPADVSMTRSLSVASVDYNEIVGLFETRDGSRLGLIGSALPETFLVHTSVMTRFQIVALVALGILLVIGLGVFLADRITHPLLRVVRASTQVAQGNLNVAVEPTGNDEVADLAHSFNYMISGLREGSIYRDLLGRTVSPEVRERLRDSIASGRVRLEGQEAVATVLMADIRSFTTLSEHAEPTQILNWLNEYFGELVPIIAAHSGVVNKFDGDAVLAFFGILPVRLSEEESAYRACRATLEMLKTIDGINVRRRERGDPPFVTGIGVNTGPVTAGGLGTPDRLSYTIIGDTVNTTQRVEELTREFGESGAVITEYTKVALGPHLDEFSLEPLGPQVLRGKQEPISVYRLSL